MRDPCTPVNTEKSMLIETRCSVERANRIIEKSIVAVESHALLYFFDIDKPFFPLKFFLKTVKSVLNNLMSNLSLCSSEGKFECILNVNFVIRSS